MKRTSRQFIVAYVVIANALWAASQWWEKGMATRVDEPDISPSGCYRVETLKPFWVLPNIFHPRMHPDELDKPQWFPWWGYPGFFRLYDHRNNKLIGESEIFDLESASGKIYWGQGTGNISSGLIHIGKNLPDCFGDRPSTLQLKE